MVADWWEAEREGGRVVGVGDGVRSEGLPCCPGLRLYPYTEGKSHLSFETYYPGPCSFAKRQRGTLSYWMKSRKRAKCELFS